MPSALLVFFATLPLLVLLLPRWIEPYALLDPASLNRPAQGQPGDSAETRWFNMGWWEETDSFPQAAEALATKLLTFAKEGGYQGGGAVLDIGHGAGESLLIHLASSPPPETLHGLTSLALDTTHARALLAAHPELTSGTAVELFTGSAEFREGRDLGHPLNPMRGFMGEQRVSTHVEYDDDEDEDEDELYTNQSDTRVEGRAQSEEEGDAQELFQANPGAGATVTATRYDLVYILDSIYHYPPSLDAFLETLRPVLSPNGMVVYTDILPPRNLGRIPALLLSHILRVPLPNLLHRPDTVEAYEAQLSEAAVEKAQVRVEDWSEGVWDGFARHLEARGGMWGGVARGIRWAQRSGWKFVAVRIVRST